MDQCLTDIECPTCGGLYVPRVMHVGDPEKPWLEYCGEKTLPDNRVTYADDD